MPEELSRLEKDLIVLKGDVEHIKTRIDNGMSSTITKIYEKLMEIHPIVNENKFWVDKFKWGIVWIAIIAVGGGLVTLVFNAVSRI